MFVLPGTKSLLLSQHATDSSPSQRGLLLIADGVATLLTNAPTVALMQPSLSSNVFYSYDDGVVPSGVDRIEMDGANITTTSVGGLTLDTEPEIRSSGNLLFFSSGEVVDPEAMIHLGTFPGLAL